jgi:hypothetical protein
LLRVTKVDRIRRFKSRGYVLMDTWKTFDSNESISMRSSYSWPELQYIGDKKIAYLLWNRFGITDFYPSSEYTPANLEELNKRENTKNLLRYNHEFIPFLNKAKVCSIGWSPSQQKWYGWSHRAINSFTIGSRVERNSPAFVPPNKQEAIKSSIEFWSGDYKEKIRFLKDETRNGVDGFWIEFLHSDSVPNEKLRGKTASYWCEYPEVWGNGEWTAESLEDAKQMAIDFAEGVG